MRIHDPLPPLPPLPTSPSLPSLPTPFRTLKNYRDPVFVAPRIMGKLVTCEGPPPGGREETRGREGGTEGEGGEGREH